MSDTEVTTTTEVTPLETTEATAPAPAIQAQDPLDKAAFEFSRLMPQIKGYARTMNGKGLARVLSAVVEFPLADSYPKFRDKAETELFMMCLHAQGAKNIMTDSVFKNQEVIKEIEKQAVDSVVEEYQQNNKETDNGGSMEETGNTTQG